jgi:hypothetical protein
MARYDDHEVHDRANQQRRRLWAAQGGGAPLEDPDPLVRPPSHQPHSQPQPPQQHQRAFHAAAEQQRDPHQQQYHRPGQAAHSLTSAREDDLAVSKATSIAGSSTTLAPGGSRSSRPPQGIPAAAATSAPPSDSSTAQPTPQSRPTPLDASLPLPGMQGGPPQEAPQAPADQQPQPSPPREKLEKLAAQTRLLHEAVQRYRLLLADETQRREAAEARVAELEARGGNSDNDGGPSRCTSASPAANEPGQGNQAPPPMGAGEREELLGRVDVLERQNAMLRDRLLSSTVGAGAGGGGGGGHYVSSSRLPSRSPAAAAALASASRASLPPPSGGRQLDLTARRH